MEHHSSPVLASMLVLQAVCLLAVSAWRVGGDRYHPEPADEAVRAAGAAGAWGRTDAEINPAERTASFWVEQAQAAVERRARRSSGRGKARNVVMFLGDGMSVPTLAAARTLLGQRNGQTGEEAQLSFEDFPTVGLSKTYCVNQQIADSACTATAYLTGVKNNNGMLGLTAAVARRDCNGSLDASAHLESIAAWALADGRDAGIVTTTRITHASPAGAYAVSANRGWENDASVAEDGADPTVCRDIAHQLVYAHPGNKFKVILGGGRRNFIPNEIRDEEGTRGRRTDGRHVIQEWQEDKRSRNVSFAYVWNRFQLMSMFDSPPEYLLGLFEGSHMQYHMEADESMEPTLAELTEIAIRSLSRNENGFFLFVEGGRIDHAHHDNYAELALDETIELSKAVTRATELLSAEDSLVVVTADHAHVMAFNGYRRRGGNILGRSGDVDLNNVRYTTLSYTNGPGARPQVDGVRVDVTRDSNFGALQFRSHAEVPLEEETHGGDDVAVFAWGAHHDMFSGLYEQNQIPHLMAYAGCFGPGRHACTDAPAVDAGDGSGNDNSNGAVTIRNTFTTIILTLILATIIKR